MSLANSDNYVLDQRRIEVNRQQPNFLQNLISSIRNARKQVNCEPVIFLIAIAFGVHTSVQQLFLFWARCIQLNNGFENPKYAFEFCAKISLQNDSHSIDIVERDMAHYSIYVQLCSTLATLISAPILGSWSDSHGRKTSYIFCVTGLTFFCFFQTIGVLFYTRINIWYIQFLAEFTCGIMGGISMVFIMSTTVVADDSRDHLDSNASGIPLRIGIASGIQFFGVFLGTFVYFLFSKPLNLSIRGHINGYLYSYAIAFLSSFFALLYLIFCLRESHNVQEIDRQRFFSSEGYQDSNLPKPGFVHNLFFYLKKAIKVVTVRRASWTRFCLILTILSLFIQMMTTDNQLLTLILKRSPFYWPDELLNLYMIFENVLLSLGTILAPLILLYVNCIGSESYLLMVAIFGSGLNQLAISIAKNTQQILISAILYILIGGVLPGFQTVLAKMVRKDQTARLFSFVSLVMVICPLVSKTLFNQIYEITLNIWPGFVFFLMAILHIIALSGQIIVHILMLPLWSIQTSIYNPMIEEIDTEENNSENHSISTDQASVSVQAVLAE